MSSNRIVPEQFGNGLTVDATRLERNVIKVDELGTPPPKYIRRRYMPSWLVWGQMSDNLATPMQFPWLREKNDNISATYSPLPVATNLFRHKAVYTPEIQHNGGGNALYTWEVSFETKHPTYLTKLFAFMAVDADFQNDGHYGGVPPVTKTAFAWMSDAELQVFVDDNLDPENRARTSVEAGAIQQSMDTLQMCVTLIDPAWDTMVPAHPAGAVTGYRFTVDCDVLLPPGRIRLAMTIPQYAIVTDWNSINPFSWQSAVWSIGVKLNEEIHAAT